MGYVKPGSTCSTFSKWSNKTGASGADRTEFAPVLQLLQPLKGYGEVEHWSAPAARARFQHSEIGGTPPAGAFGLPGCARLPHHQQHGNSP
jgi:hypothetical protein